MGGIGEPERLERCIRFVQARLVPGEQPSVRERPRRRRGQIRHPALFTHREDQPSGVPHLVREAPARVEVLLAEWDALRLGRLIRQAEPQRVGALPGDRVERVDHVPERLRHLAALRVADQPVDHHVEERDVARQEQAAHDHARDPEVQDLVPRHEGGRRIEGPKIGCLIGPTQRRVRPQLGGEPRVEHVGILNQLGGSALGARRRVLDRRDLVAVRAVPHGDAMPPPQLPRDVPVAQVVQPLRVRALPAPRPERDAAVERRLLRRAFQRIHLHEPLLPVDPRFDLGLAAVAAADRVDVRALHLHD